jgi:predicted nucleotidyltransferase
MGGMETTERETMIGRLRKIKKSLRREGFIIDGLFGSFARGDEGPESDIDLLYHVEPPFLRRYRGFAALARLEAIKTQLAKELGRPVDLAPSNNLSETGKRFILEERIDV